MVCANLQEVAKCQATDARLTLSDVCSTYARLKKQCREEYVMYNLAAAALAQVSLRSCSHLSYLMSVTHLLSTLDAGTGSMAAAINACVTLWVSCAGAAQIWHAVGGLAALAAASERGGAGRLCCLAPAA